MWERLKKIGRKYQMLHIQRKVNVCAAQLQNVTCSSYDCFSGAIQDQQHEDVGGGNKKDERENRSNRSQ